MALTTKTKKTNVSLNEEYEGFAIDYTINYNVDGLVDVQSAHCRKTQEEGADPMVNPASASITTYDGKTFNINCHVPSELTNIGAVIDYAKAQLILIIENKETY